MRASILFLLFAGCIGGGKPDDSDATDPDADGDGSPASVDCDDGDPDVHPGATEVCDPADVDEDCSGTADDADDGVDAGTRTTTFADTDGDGFGDAAVAQDACDAAAGWVTDATDCDDTNGRVNPAAAELCDGVDDDCDTEIDEADAADAPAWHLDDDGDGYGDPASSRVQCDMPSGYVLDGTDCDDVSAGVHPDADERCDGEDDDCDGDVDEDDAIDVGTWYGDDDGDGYGETADSTIDCDAPDGYVAFDGDCDDRDATVSPGAVEVCDGADADEDCDGLADDADTAATGKTAWYADVDGDGYGDPFVVTAACDLPSGDVATDDDCDDADALIHPGATEVCDAGDTDEDCDGAVDDADASVDPAGYATWYVDADADGYGTATATRAACDVPIGYSAVSTDCDDATSVRSPGRTEVCDAADTDEDCDGLADDADSAATGGTTWYVDADADGYGSASSSIVQCDVPVGYDATAGDCDDRDAGVNPGESEVCSTSADEDCDGIGLCDVTSADADRAFYPTAGNQYVGYRVAGGDLDGDGVDELLVTSTGASSYAGAVYAFTGGGTGDTAVTAADATVTGISSSSQIGSHAAVVLGDVDGDGGNDLGVTAPYDSTAGSYAGALYVLNGPLSGTSSAASAYATILGDNHYGSLAEIAAVGDIDGDALADVLVGAGRGYLLTGLDAAPTSVSGAAATFTAEASGGNLGSQVAAIGDADGDGVDDLVMSDTIVDGVGAVYLFLGPQTGTVSAATADGKRTGQGGAYAGTYLAKRGGDVDGDGYPDLAATDYSFYATPTTWLIAGPMTGTATITSTSVRVYDSSSTTGTLGSGIADDGDFDGDGFADLAVSDYYESDGATYAGAVYVFLGPLSGSLTPASADVTIRGDSYQQMLGFSLSYVGPESGTTDELLIGSWYNSSFTSYGGGAYLFSAGSL